MDIEDDDAFLYGDEPEQQPQSTAQVQAQAQAQAEAQAQAAKESAISASMAAYACFPCLYFSHSYALPSSSLSASLVRITSISCG